MPDANDTVQGEVDGTEPETASQEHRPWLVGHVLVGVAIVMVMVALAAGAVGMRVRSAAHDSREQATKLAQERLAKKHDREAAVSVREDVNQRATAVTKALDALHVALDNAADTQHRFSDQVNHRVTSTTRATPGVRGNVPERGEHHPGRAHTPARGVRAALTAPHDARDDLEEVLR